VRRTSPVAAPGVAAAPREPQPTGAEDASAEVAPDDEEDEASAAHLKDAARTATLLREQLSRTLGRDKPRD